MKCSGMLVSNIFVSIVYLPPNIDPENPPILVRLLKKLVFQPLSIYFLCMMVYVSVSLGDDIGHFQTHKHIMSLVVCTIVFHWSFPRRSNTQRNPRFSFECLQFGAHMGGVLNIMGIEVRIPQNTTVNTMWLL